MQPTSDRAHHAKVLIIGAGPSGAATALRLARHGIRDVVLVDTHGFPRDKTCGSGLSARAIGLLKGLQIWERIEAKAYPIHGVRLVTPRGREYNGGGQRAGAVILLRRYLDYEILQAAIEGGTRFIPDFRAAEPILENGRWAGARTRDGQSVHADHVVVANGTHSKFVIDQRPRKLIHAIMGWWDGVPFTPHRVEMLWVPMVAPYYGWLFPESETRVNIGITYEDDGNPYNARQRFEHFLGKYYAKRLEGATQVGRFKGHPISYTYDIAKLHSPGRVIIGEAGRMVHPATGEGIYFGMQSGCYAADALKEILVDGRDETWAMRRYQLRCTGHFTPSFWAGGLFRRALRTPALDWLAAVADRPGVRNLAAAVIARM